jgi:hypothetical protein
VSADTLDDDRPWERLGAPRRDCVPHRAGLVFSLGLLALILGVLSFWLLLTAAIVWPLAGAVCAMARQDLREMRAGAMDPAGEDDVSKGRECALYGAALGVVGALMWAMILSMIWAGG